MDDQNFIIRCVENKEINCQKEIRKNSAKKIRENDEGWLPNGPEQQKKYTSKRYLNVRRETKQKQRKYWSTPRINERAG